MVRGRSCKINLLQPSDGALQSARGHLTSLVPFCSGLDHVISKGMALLYRASKYRGLRSMAMERGDDSWVSASKCLLDWLKEFSTALWVADCRRAGGGDTSCRLKIGSPGTSFWPIITSAWCYSQTISYRISNFITRREEHESDEFLVTWPMTPQRVS